MSPEHPNVRNVSLIHNLYIVDSITNKEYGGDVNIISVREKSTLVEENNNEIDILTKNFEEMGNITDKFKRKNNVNEKYKVNTMETQSEESHRDMAYGDTDKTYRAETSRKVVKKQVSTDYEYNSDEFEEDEVEDDDYLEEDVSKHKLNGSSTARCKRVCRKSDHIEDLNVKESIGSHSQRSSGSAGEGRSSQRDGLKEDSEKNFYAVRAPSRGISALPTMPGPPPRRINMSFTNTRSREIERENHILLRKILRSRCTKSSPCMSAAPAPIRHANPAYIARRKIEERIERDNLILLRKIQRAKPSNLSIRK